MRRKNMELWREKICRSLLYQSAHVRWSKCMFCFQAEKSSGMDNKLNVVWNTVFQQGQNWGDSVFFGKVIHFLVEFSFSFCALLYVRYCEYSGVHWADSREEAPSHAACSAVGTLCQPHCCLHTGRERSCHQVGAHRIMINAANSHFTAFIFA